MAGESTSITLDDAERVLLAELLESAYRDLKAEIGRTEDTRFRAELQARRDTLRVLLEKAGGAPLTE